jgi:hypothetical protein
MRRWHLITGLVGVAAFLASGIYMRMEQTFLHDETTRMLYRSTHIYILFASLLNLALGLHLTAPRPGWRRCLQRTGSVLVLVPPLLLIAGFLTEPRLSELARPYSRPAIIACLAGMVLHVASVAGRRADSPGERDNAPRSLVNEPTRATESGRSVPV